MKPRNKVRRQNTKAWTHTACREATASEFAAQVATAEETNSLPEQFDGERAAIREALEAVGL